MTSNISAWLWSRVCQQLNTALGPTAPAVGFAESNCLFIWLVEESESALLIHLMY